MLEFFCLLLLLTSYSFFFFNDTATTEIYTLSLHDALPIYLVADFAEVFFLAARKVVEHDDAMPALDKFIDGELDRKSTRLNSSHSQISYAVFCLKKKKKKHYTLNPT